MRLYESMMEACTILVLTETRDTVGGVNKAWTDGETINAAIVKNSTMENEEAEKERVNEQFTITLPKGMSLNYHDVIRRESDGDIFRVTSIQADSETPIRATFQFGQVQAERWELT